MPAEKCFVWLIVVGVVVPVVVVVVVVVEVCFSLLRRILSYRQW